MSRRRDIGNALPFRAEDQKDVFLVFGLPLSISSCFEPFSDFFGNVPAEEAFGAEEEDRD